MLNEHIVDIDLLQSFSMLPDHLLPLLTQEEADAYTTALKNHEALLSPLNLAIGVSGGKPFDAARFVDKHLVALVEGRLYPSGVGPPPMYLEGATGGDETDEEGRWGHPTEEGNPEPLYFLALSEPPRHGKSYLTSFHMSAWYLLRFPNRNVAVASYESKFAASWGKLVRDLIKKNGARFGITLDPTHYATDNFGLEFPYTGEMYAVGVGGAFTGKGSHHTTIDDPIKNHEAALSPTQRLSSVNWYQSVAYTRREPAYVYDQNGVVRKRPGTVIIMNTRWHEEDLMGWVVKNEPDKWFSLNLPAISQEDDPMGRAPGKALVPERFSVADLGTIRSAIGSYWFSAMYQGNPSVEGGGIIPKPYHYYRHEAKDGELGHYFYTDPGGTDHIATVESCRRFGTMDIASSLKTSADYTVLAVWDTTPNNDLMLHALWRKRLEGPDHLAMVKEWLSSLKKPLLYLGVEDKMFGSSLISTLNKEGFVPVRPLKAETDKISRAIPAGIAIGAGQVYFPKHASFISDFVHELEQFPNGSHDDQVDCLAYAVLERNKFGKQTQKPVEDSTLEGRLKTYIDKKERLRRAPKTMLGRW